ncbi:MAG TPA: exodeoxyribonuclease VII large subunit, partial [Planctomycetota bacterium]|nr:exodeoxyribonuclease VII large subunit [Planctomycetota bacterium]
VVPRLAAARARVDAAGRALTALDPTAVLARGYSLTWIEDAGGARRLVRDASEAPDGATLRTVFARGDALRSKVVGRAPKDEGA